MTVFLLGCIATVALVVRGLKLRHDHGSNNMSGDFREEHFRVVTPSTSAQ